jgi:hypothetical protein
VPGKVAVFAGGSTGIKQTPLSDKIDFYTVSSGTMQSNNGFHYLAPMLALPMLANGC